MIVERSPNMSCFKIKVVVHFLKEDCISVSNLLLASILKTTFIKPPRFRRSYWNIGNCEPSTLVIKTSSKRSERRDAINDKVTMVLKTTSKAIIKNHDDWYLFLYSIPPFHLDSWKCAWIIKAEWIVSDHPQSSFWPSSPLVGAAECWQESGNKIIALYLSIPLETCLIWAYDFPFSTWEKIYNRKRCRVKLFQQRRRDI